MSPRLQRSSRIDALTCCAPPEGLTGLSRISILAFRAAGQSTPFHLGCARNSVATPDFSRDLSRQLPGTDVDGSHLANVANEQTHVGNDRMGPRLAGDR